MTFLLNHCLIISKHQKVLLEKKYDYADYIEIDKTAKELGIILEFIEKLIITIKRLILLGLLAMFMRRMLYLNLQLPF